MRELLIIVLIMTMITSASASMSITASVSADSAMVGDALTLDVVITGVPKDAKIVPPETEKGFGDFTVLAWEDLSIQNANTKSKVNTKDRDSSKYQYKYSIATYKPENCTIPSIRFIVNNAAGDDTLSTIPIPIRIISALPAAPPDSGGFAIKDLKAQQKAGKADLWYLWIILGIVLVVAAIILMRKYLKKKDGAAAAPVVNLLPPYEEAMEAIEALDRKKYLGQGMVREYVFELSEIFKRYIGRRYDIIAPELTTEEITAWLEFSDISREMRMCAERFFRSGDQVKFAKLVPDGKCVDGYRNDVLMFIEATKPDTTLPYERKTERMGVAQ